MACFFFEFGGVFEGTARHSHRQVDRVGLLGDPRDVVDSCIFDPHVSAQAAFASRSEEANGTRRGHMMSHEYIIILLQICKYVDMRLLFFHVCNLDLACEALEKVVGAQSKPHLQRHVLL